MKRAVLPRLTGPPFPSINLSQRQKKALDHLTAARCSGALTMDPVPCPCLSADDLLVADFDRYGNTLRTVLCARCGLMRSDPYYNQESLEAYYRDHYRELYSQNGPKEIFEHEEARGEGLLRWLRPRVKTHNSWIVLDLGCGAGGTMAVFRRAGHQVMGFDFNKEFLEFANSYGLEVHLGAPKESVVSGADVVLLIHVLEHFRDPVRDLAAIAQNMKPGAMLIIELPGVLSIRRQYRDPALFLQDAHSFSYCSATLRYVATKAGLALVAVDEEIRAVFVKAGNLDEPALTSPSTVRRVIRSLRRAELCRNVPRREDVRRALMSLATWVKSVAT